MAAQFGSAKPAPIVAELGRPETPDEIAARKAESSRSRRANQTSLNLLLSIGASLLIVLFLLVVVVRPTAPAPTSVDWQQLAKEAQPTVTEPLASPRLPKAWHANSAQLAEGSDGIQAWYIGFITPDQQFIAMTQGIKANPTWVSNQLGGKATTGSTIVDGVLWSIYDYRSLKDPGNLAYSMSSRIGSSTFVLNGTATTSEFDSLATAIAGTLTGNTQ